MKLPIGKTLEEIRFKSYYYNHELICTYIILYFRFDNDWFKMISCDGKSEFESTEEPKIVTLESFGVDEYAYPISSYLEWDRNKFKKLIQVQECLWKGISDASCGFLLSFENGNFITAIDIDDCYSFAFQKNNNILKDCTLLNKF